MLKIEDQIVTFQVALAHAAHCYLTKDFKVLRFSGISESGSAFVTLEMKTKPRMKTTYCSYKWGSNPNEILCFIQVVQAMAKTKFEGLQVPESLTSDKGLQVLESLSGYRGGDTKLKAIIAMVGGYQGDMQQVFDTPLVVIMEIFSMYVEDPRVPLSELLELVS